MNFGSSFNNILQNRRMDLADLAIRSGVEQPLLEAAMEHNFDLTAEQVERLAAELAVPTVALFSNAELTLSNVPDFRKSNPHQVLLEPETIKAIGYVEKISLSLASLELDLSASDEIEKYIGPLDKASAKQLAEFWRRKWGISNSQQLEWRSAAEVYSSLRSYIEKLGVFVLHYSFGTDVVSGLYTKVDGGPHTILINTTKSSRARKLFTLAHEFCHVLMRADGVSNPSIINNKIEKFCNQFAAFLLAPESLLRDALSKYGYVPSLNGDSIRLLSKNLGISQQACVLRLVDLGLLKKNDYGLWMSRFSGPVPDGDQEDPQGGIGGSDPIKSKKTHYGYSFLSKLREARNSGLLDAIEIYRLAGIKPKYQNALLGG